MTIMSINGIECTFTVIKWLLNDNISFGTVILLSVLGYFVVN